MIGYANDLSISLQIHKSNHLQTLAITELVKRKIDFDHLYTCILLRIRLWGTAWNVPCTFSITNVADQPCNYTFSISCHTHERILVADRYSKAPNLCLPIKSCVTVRYAILFARSLSNPQQSIVFGSVSLCNRSGRQAVSN